MDPTQTVSPADSSETLNETDLRGCFSEGLDQQKSLVKQKEAELKEMQDQIESYNQMVKQLASQREMAVKKLSEMDIRIEELNKLLESERVQVELKDKELKTKRTQLQALKNEESELKEKFETHQQELDTMTENLTNTQLQESQVKTKLTDLTGFLAMADTAIEDIERAISIKDTIKLSALCNQMLTPPQPLSTNAILTNGIKSFANTNDTNQDSLFDGSANFDPFANDDPFEGDDPFKSEEQNLALPEDDPFNPSSTGGSKFMALGQNDPFAPQ